MRDQNLVNRLIAGVGFRVTDKSLRFGIQQPEGLPAHALKLLSPKPS